MAVTRQLQISFFQSNDTNNSSKTTETSKGTITDNFTQSTSSKQPVQKLRGNAHSSLANFCSSALCDGGDTMSTGTTRSIGGSSSSYSIIIAWTNGDYTNDTWLLSGTSNDAHWGIKAGGTDVIYKADGTKGSAAERDYPTNSTANSTVSHTFGSDVEMLAITLDNVGILECNIYNIDGDKIADASAVNSSALGVAFPIDHIIGKSDGTLGLNGEIIDIIVCNNTVLDVGTIKAFGRRYKALKNKD